MKDYLQYQGNNAIHGSRDATREAFELGLLQDGDIWMSMIKSRNQSAHTYNKETADEISRLILNNYFSLFKTLEQKMTELANAD